jgi:hypothetical protein
MQARETMRLLQTTHHDRQFAGHTSGGTDK